MRLLITGCHGFVGGSLGRFAAQVGHRVLGIGLPSQSDFDWPGSYCQADVTHADLSAVINEFQPDMLLHGVGTASVARSLQDPLVDLRTAVQSWANVLDSVRRSSVRPRLVFPSSAAVYGDPDFLPVPEDSRISPISPYGFHKVMCELVAREYAECYGLNIIIVRLFSLFGPRQRRLLIWELFSQAVGEGAEIVLQGTGTETRDYLHIDDMSKILLQLGSSNPSGLLTVNVASGAAAQTVQVAQHVANLVGTDKPVRCLCTTRPGDPLHWRADVNLLQTLTTTRPLNFLDRLAECIREWQCA